MMRVVGGINAPLSTSAGALGRSTSGLVWSVGVAKRQGHRACVRAFPVPGRSEQWCRLK